MLRKGRRAGTWSGYFGPAEQDALVRAVAPVSEAPRQRLTSGDHPRIGEANIYFSLQAVRPDIAEGRRGALARCRTTTRDKDVRAYTLFVVDVDPERKPGISATDAEKAAARQVAERVRLWLLERGAQALLADSGNGYHLLVPLVPAVCPAVEEAARDAHDVLRLLDREFSTDGAKVDTSTFNPSRILKLYGTEAVKGEDTEERPHRFASIDLSAIPDDIDLCAAVAADIEAFRAPPPQAPPPPRQVPSGPRSSEWSDWRLRALDVLPLESVCGELLTGERGMDALASSLHLPLVRRATFDAHPDRSPPGPAGR